MEKMRIKISVSSVLIVASLLFGGNVFGFSRAAGACSGDCNSCHSLKLSEAQSILDSFSPSLKAVDVETSPASGLWEVTFDYHGRKNVIYVNFDKKHIVRGSIIDIKTKKDMTSERVSYLNRVDVSRIPLDDALILGRSDARVRVIVFDDPV